MYESYMLIGDLLIHREYMARKAEDYEARLGKGTAPKQPSRSTLPTLVGRRERSK